MAHFQSTDQTVPYHATPCRATPLRGAFRHGFGAATLRAMLSALRQRRALSRLDARLLDDIGVDRDQARAEANRPVWDVPQTWLR